ncbi:hypothetical protein CO046_03245 [Candidatus Peregrinibacteria bacterium CG_4_9_14_0_2_um_filter_53_11]|nr:MAG: hypothetical protein CO046_03245 [Candidatus Peregrinibacteria bacterium CG_4_9_14_0_2_um_filter_53_11]
MKITIITLLSLTLLILVAACGRSSGTLWITPDGTRVSFSRVENDSPGRDDTKRLEVVYPDGEHQAYSFGQNHAGYGRIELRLSDNARYVCLFDTTSPNITKMGPCIDLEDKIFFDEDEQKPEAVPSPDAHLIQAN